MTGRKKIHVKPWNISFAIDAVFAISAAVLMFLANAIVNVLPLVRFVQEYTLDEVTNDPSLLPPNIILYSGAFLAIAIPLIFFLLIGFIFAVTRHYYYRNNKNYKESILQMLGGLFVFSIPATLVMFLFIFIASWISFAVPIIKPVADSFIIATFFAAHAIFFLKADKGVFAATKNTWEIVTKKASSFFIAPLLLTVASVVFMLIGRVLPPVIITPLNVTLWTFISYIIVIVFLSWQRTYLCKTFIND
ncbi:MAG: hypothetical protein ACMXYK_00745 [Candidatus Woesearchaeota archaeon]